MSCHASDGTCPGYHLILQVHRNNSRNPLNLPIHPSCSYFFPYYTRYTILDLTPLNRKSPMQTNRKCINYYDQHDILSPLPLQHELEMMINTTNKPKY